MSHWGAEGKLNLGRNQISRSAMYKRFHAQPGRSVHKQQIGNPKPTSWGVNISQWMTEGKIRAESDRSSATAGRSSPAVGHCSAHTNLSWWGWCPPGGSLPCLQRPPGPEQSCSGWRWSHQTSCPNWTCGWRNYAHPPRLSPTHSPWTLWNTTRLSRCVISFLVLLYSLVQDEQDWTSRWINSVIFQNIIQVHPTLGSFWILFLLQAISVLAGESFCVIIQIESILFIHWVQKHAEHTLNTHKHTAERTQWKSTTDINGFGSSFIVNNECTCAVSIGYKTASGDADKSSHTTAHKIKHLAVCTPV